MGPPRLGAGGAPPALPIGLLLLGALALLGGALWLVMGPGVLLGPVNSPILVALTHLVTLGFVGLVFAGTLQQLPAVMFVTKLAWPRLGYLTTPLLVVGAAGLVYGFAAGFSPVHLALGGMAVSLGWLLLLAQLLATAARRWPRDPASLALIVSVAFLTITVLLGLLLASARSMPGLAATAGYPVRLHLSVGLFGAFLLGIAGSGQKLLGMFALAKGGSQWRLRLMVPLIGAALLAEALMAFARLPLGPLPRLLLAAAALLQLLEVHAIYRRRLRKVLEAPIRRYLLAHLFLPLAGLLLVANQPAAAGAAFLVGFVGLAVSGMLVKIMSFLAWTARFAGSSSGGVSGGAPLLRDLLKDELEPLTTWGLALGALTLSATFVTGSPALALLAAGLMLLGSASQFAQAVHVVAATWAAGRRQDALAREGAKA